MTVKLPQKAGFVATTAEWDQLVRIAENLAAQVVQRDSALMQMQAERDAARDEVARLTKMVSDGYCHSNSCPVSAAMRQTAPAGGEARP